MTEKKIKLIFLAVCFFAVFLIYSQSLLGDFVFDDRGIVEHQALLSDLKQIGKVLTLPYWTEEAGLYRPTTLFSYVLNYLFLGSDPLGFHLINLALYALTGFLIFLLLEKIFSDKLVSFSAAILFLFLPIHTEAAANITGRAEILALFFSLLVFWELSRGKISFWRTGLWFLLALGSKETVIAALPIALSVIYLKERNFLSIWKLSAGGA